MELEKRRYLRLAAGALIMICIGIIYMWSVFGGFVIAKYGWTRADSGLTASVMIACFSVGSLIGGKFQDKFGTRWVCLIGIVLFFLGVFTSSFSIESGPAALYMTFGVIGGLGVGFAYNAVMGCCQKWFPDKINVCTGVIVTCFGLATVVFSPVVRALAEGMGINAAFQVAAVIFLVACLIGWTQISNPPADWKPAGFEAHKADLSTKQYTLAEALKTPQMWIMFFSIWFITTGFFAANPILSQLAAGRGLDANAATATVMVTGLGMACGRLLFPFLVNRIGRKWTALVLALLSALDAFIMIVAGGYAFLVCAFILGAAAGAPGAVWPTWTAENFGLKNNGANFGFILIGIGVSSLVSMRIAAALSAAIAGGADWVYFAFGGVAALVAALLILVFKPVAKEEAPVDEE